MRSCTHHNSALIPPGAACQHSMRSILLLAVSIYREEVSRYQELAIASSDITLALLDRVGETNRIHLRTVFPTLHAEFLHALSASSGQHTDPQAWYHHERDLLIPISVRDVVVQSPASSSPCLHAP
jgi:hypothetical protein